MKKKEKYYCATCANTLCRCADCTGLVEKEGKMFCDDYGEYCDDVDCCFNCDESDYCDNFKKRS